jgi:hypothetical protein
LARAVSYSGHVGQLAVEAKWRDVRIRELVREVIYCGYEGDLFKSTRLDNGLLRESLTSRHSRQLNSSIHIFMHNPGWW